MASKTTQTKDRSAGLFIVDNSDSDWKVRSYLREWCELSKAIDIATGYFEIGSLLALDEKWQAVDHFRILMGDEVSMRTKRAFAEGLKKSRRGSMEISKRRKRRTLSSPGCPPASPRFARARSSAVSIARTSSTRRLTSPTRAPRSLARRPSARHRKTPARIPPPRPRSPRPRRHARQAAAQILHRQSAPPAGAKASSAASASRAPTRISPPPKPAKSA